MDMKIMLVFAMLVMLSACAGSQVNSVEKCRMPAKIFEDDCVNTRHSRN